MTIYKLDILLSQFGSSLLLYVQFYLMFPDLHTDFSRDRSGGLVFPSLSEFYTAYCDPHKGFGVVNKADIGVFPGTSLVFDDTDDIGNLISGFFTFSKSSLNI